MPRRGFGSSGRRKRKGHALLSHSHAPRTYTFHEHSPSSPSSSSSERSEPETMQVGVTPLGRTGTVAQNNTNPPVTTWREWAFGTVGKGIRRKMRSAAYKSRKRNRRRH